jgi:hypothetical protein
LSIFIAVLILLLAMAGCLAGFLFLLVRHDLSPRIAIEKIRNRFAKQLPAQFPGFGDAPYRRLTNQPAPHRPVLLNLQTSEGTGQAVHPDVTYVPEGLGTGRWRYWMVCTPYPYGNFLHENPEIFASHDGIHWTIPDGVKNPLIPKPAGMQDYNSDPDMLFLNGKLWLYYRETRRTSESWETRIWLTRSGDGAQWGAPVEVLADRGDEALLMSPAVIHEDRMFRMWTVERIEGKLQVLRRDSADGVSWDQPFPCSVVGLSEREPWHLDVIREENRLSALFVSVKAGGNWRLHYANSLDEGNTWNVEPFLLEPAYEFEEAFHYRATMLKTGSSPHRYQIWYSASNRRLMHSIAYLEMTRQNSNLEPAPQSAHEELALAPAPLTN